jgi:DNA-binding CsgD family transcriptional regulator
VEIGTFIEATNRSATLEEVFGHFESALATLGFDRIMYSALRDHPIYDSHASPSVMRNYPDDWVKYYVDKNYIRLDPVRTVCLGSRAAFTWDDMVRRNRLHRDQKAVMDEGREAGLKDGIAVPLHGPHGEVMGVGMASSTGGVDAEHHLPLINLLTQHFHFAYTSLAHPELLLPPKSVLTARETEILTWVAAGKGDGVIADILGISEHGVDFHMRNIRNKLNADSRVTAVVKALRHGIINP